MVSLQPERRSVNSIQQSRFKRPVLIQDSGQLDQGNPDPSLLPGRLMIPAYRLHSVRAVATCLNKDVSG
jgi:hypothetical protein